MSKVRNMTFIREKFLNFFIIIEKFLKTDAEKGMKCMFRCHSSCIQCSIT